MDNLDLTEILEKIYQKIVKEVTVAYYNGEIQSVLEKYDLAEKEEYVYFDKNHSKILVLGASRVNVNDLLDAAKKYGISKDKIEFELDYERLKHYNFKCLECSTKYSDVLIGPHSHKVKDLEDYSSFLAKIEKNREKYFFRATKIETTNDLKITRTAFEKALQKTKYLEELYC